ncbi:MAG: hypothetical protein ACO3VO_06020 [Ilumatobacteraceae bacterium]
MEVASPDSDALAAMVPVAALPPETVVPKFVVVPYSNFGVVVVDPASIVPESVAEVAPIADGELVLIEIAPTDDATLLAVHPEDGRMAWSSFAA